MSVNSVLGIILCIVVLLSQGCVPTRPSTPPSATKSKLMVAIKYGNEKEAAQLIRTQTGIGVIDSNGRNALHYAAKYLRQTDILIALIKSGENLNIKDVKGMYPINYVIDANDAKHTALLIYYGADVKGIDLTQVRYQVPGELKRLRHIAESKDEYKSKCIQKKSKYSYKSCLALLEATSIYVSAEEKRQLSCAKNKWCKTSKSFSNALTKACNVNMKNCLMAVKKDIHGVFITADIEKKVSVLNYKESCTGSSFNYSACKVMLTKYSDTALIGKVRAALTAYKPKGERFYEKSCGLNGSLSSCKKFANSHAGFKSQQEMDAALASLAQKCRVNDKGWIYKGTRCKSGKAHGRGVAVMFDKALKFQGTFKNGERVQGKLFANDVLMYDGPLDGGRPNGSGICMHNSEPERCEFYNGKRVDAIYKQRMAYADQQKEIDEKLAKMAAMQQAQMNQIQNQINYSSKGQSSGKTNSMGDVVMDKAIEAGMNQLFNKLF